MTRSRSDEDDTSGRRRGLVCSLSVLSISRSTQDEDDSAAVADGGAGV